MTDTLEPIAETGASPFALECYPTTPLAPEIVPGRPDRDWMDAFAARHPYRCLPLTMANTTGWEILCPMGFEAEWTGGLAASDIRLRPDEGAQYFEHFATSHFTHGVLTFHTGWLFRTPPGWALRASGVPNRFKHGIAPMEGLIETDWLPYPFTMNWRFTAPGVVRFEKGEPFCFIAPVPHGQVAAFQPVQGDLEQTPELNGQYKAWTKARTLFNDSLAAGDPEAMKQAWQRYYFRGEYPDRDDRPEEHVNKRRLASLKLVPTKPAPVHAPFNTWSATSAARTPKGG